MLVDDLHYNQCNKFSEFLSQHLPNFSLVKKCSCLFDAWILVGSIEYRVLDLLGIVISLSTYHNLNNFLLRLND